MLSFLEDDQFLLKDTPAKDLLFKMILFYLYREGCVQRRRGNKYF